MILLVRLSSLLGISQQLVAKLNKLSSVRIDFEIKFDRVKNTQNWLYQSL
jgi:hypothetical protein